MLGYKPDFFEVDLRDKKWLERIFKKYNFDWVLHFAGAKSPFESQQNPLYYYDNNISGSLHLFDLMNSYNVKNLIFSSSANVYSWVNKSPIDESGSLWPNNPYGRTKFLLEEILRDLHKFSWFNVILLRYFNPIWSHVSGLIWEHLEWVPNNIFPYIMKVVSGELDGLQVFGWDYNTPDGTCLRDYIDINDLVHGHLLAYNRLSDEPESFFDTFNLWTGAGTSVLELLQSVEETLKLKVRYNMAPKRDWDLPIVFCNVDKAEKILWFQCNFSKEDSIRNTWKFCKNLVWKK
jgi:UDP-glucose 4-epimerase